jgi:PTH1 family peptidyl-tRNA hydrolase
LWAIVGLGNPGGKYSRTRHNIGFMVVEEIALRYKIRLSEKKLYRSGEGAIGESSIALIEPLTFMNSSGIAVKEAMKRFNISPGNIVVVHDDMDINTGRLKIRRDGGSGGHKGVESIIQIIGTKDFTRVKAGIGRNEALYPEKYVLSPFRADEQEAVSEMIRKASDAVSTIACEGVTKAMNRFNQKQEADI